MSAGFLFFFFDKGESNLGIQEMDCMESAGNGVIVFYMCSCYFSARFACAW